MTGKISLLLRLLSTTAAVGVTATGAAVANTALLQRTAATPPAMTAVADVSSSSLDGVVQAPEGGSNADAAAELAQVVASIVSAGGNTEPPATVVDVPPVTGVAPDSDPAPARGVPGQTVAPVEANPSQTNPPPPSPIQPPRSAPAPRPADTQPPVPSTGPAAPRPAAPVGTAPTTRAPHHEDHHEDEHEDHEERDDD